MFSLAAIIFETEGHVENEDNLTQINTGRLYTYIQSATCDASVNTDPTLIAASQIPHK
jgi:hypothetical protein